MKWLSFEEMKVFLIVFIAAVVLGSRSTRADFTFGTPTNLGSVVNSSAYDEAPSISADGLTLYFNSNRPGGYGAFDLWKTTRSTKESAWGLPENLGPTVNSSAREGGASISADGLSLYFNSTRPGGYGPALWGDIWVTERATTSETWDEPVNLGPIVNSSSHAFGASISYDGLSLFFGSDRADEPGNDDICVTTRATIDDHWQEPVNLGFVVNSSAHDGGPSISSDGLALFFSGYASTPYRSGGYGNADLWITIRSAVSDTWGEPVNLGPAVNTSDYDFLPCISSDGRTLYFMSDRPGGEGDWDLWKAPIIPIVDFNGDGIVDIHDLVIMIENWSTSESLCDIGPMPWGDGIVNDADLEILMSYWGQVVDVAAYWKLDEAKGNIASDSAGGHDGTLHGEPIWQPEGGMVDGAFELDGIDDYVSAPFILNPADGVFSVFAWIKGGAPDQVIISQANGVNWLLTDSTEGNLMTELKGEGRSSTLLVSQTVINDGDWHRIGFVWDGTNRILYVDDIEVASDTQNNLIGSTSGMYIGTGNVLAPDTFFSGLIDDVRIYNRAITP
jgi:Tol biopolymer transport system component